MRAVVRHPAILAHPGGLINGCRDSSAVIMIEICYRNQSWLNQIMAGVVPAQEGL